MKKLILIFTIFLACSENSSQNFTSKLNIYCILDPKARFQLVVVDRTYSEEEAVLDSGLTGATVKMIKNNDTLLFHPSDTTNGFYENTDTSWFTAGETYTLTVEYEGEKYTSTSCIPDSFHILSHKDYDTVSLSSPETLIWSLSRNAYKQTYAIMPWIMNDTIFNFNLVSLDTFASIFNYAPLFPITDTCYIVKVECADSNLYQLWRGRYNTYFTSDSSAYGLFGARYQDSVIIYIKE